MRYINIRYLLACITLKLNMHKVEKETDFGVSLVFWHFWLGDQKGIQPVKISRWESPRFFRSSENPAKHGVISGDVVWLNKNWDFGSKQNHIAPLSNVNQESN